MLWLLYLIKWIRRNNLKKLIYNVKKIRCDIYVPHLFLYSDQKVTCHANVYNKKGAPKMDIYECINSRDIREYLKAKQYTFDSLQQAFLIWQSGRHTLTQKHEAWKELIATLRTWKCPNASIAEPGKAFIKCCRTTWIWKTNT